ncbi:MAG: gephyrin-like molybdotransferase Glp, partial [Bryobacteraceae bacterium]
MALTFEQARASVLQEVSSRRVLPAAEEVAALEASGRVLAAEIAADRDYPPFARSARDGFAIRCSDIPGELRVIGEVRAGTVFSGAVGAGEAVEIMTGAPLPEGADSVVMIEHTERSGDVIRVAGSLKSGENFNARGLEAQRGAVVLTPGRRLG